MADVVFFFHFMEKINIIYLFMRGLNFETKILKQNAAVNNILFMYIKV